MNTFFLFFKSYFTFPIFIKTIPTFNRSFSNTVIDFNHFAFYFHNFQISVNFLSSKFLIGKGVRHCFATITSKFLTKPQLYKNSNFFYLYRVFCTGFASFFFFYIFWVISIFVFALANFCFFFLNLISFVFLYFVSKLAQFFSSQILRLEKALLKTPYSVYAHILNNFIKLNPVFDSFYRLNFFFVNQFNSNFKFFVISKFFAQLRFFITRSIFFTAFNLFNNEFSKSGQTNYFKLFLTSSKFRSHKSVYSLLETFYFYKNKTFQSDLLFSIFAKPYLINFFFPVFSSLFFDPKLFNLENETVENIFINRSTANDFDEGTTFLGQHPTFNTTFNVYDDTAEKLLERMRSSPKSKQLADFDFFLNSEYLVSDLQQLSYQNYFLHFYGSYNVEFFFYIYVFPFVKRKKRFTISNSFFFLQLFFNRVNFVRYPSSFFTSFFYFFPQFFKNYLFFKNKNKKSVFFSSTSKANKLKLNFFFKKIKENFFNFFSGYVSFLSQTSALQDLEYYSTYDRSFDFTQANSEDFLGSNARDLQVVDDEDSFDDYASTYSASYEEDALEDTFSDNLLGDTSTPLSEYYAFSDDFITQPFLVDDVIAESFFYPQSPDYLYDEVTKSLEQLSFETNELDLDELLFQNFYMSTVEKLVSQLSISKKFYDPVLDFDLQTDDKFPTNFYDKGAETVNDDLYSSDESDSRIDDTDFFRHPTDKKTFLIVKNYTQSYNDINVKWLALNKSFNLEPLPPFLYGIGKYLPKRSQKSFVHEVDQLLKSKKIDSQSFFKHFKIQTGFETFFHPYKNDSEFLKSFFYTFQSPSYLYPQSKYLSLFIVFNNLQKNFDFKFNFVDSKSANSPFNKSTSYSPHLTYALYSVLAAFSVKTDDGIFNPQFPFPRILKEDSDDFNKTYRDPRYNSGLKIFLRSLRADVRDKGFVKSLFPDFKFIIDRLQNKKKLTKKPPQFFVPTFSEEKFFYKFQRFSFQQTLSKRKKRFLDFFYPTKNLFKSFFNISNIKRFYYRLNWRFPFTPDVSPNEDFRIFNHKLGEFGRISPKYTQKPIHPKIIFRILRKYSSRRTFYRGKNDDLSTYLQLREAKDEYLFHSDKYFYELGWIFKGSKKEGNQKQKEHPIPYSRYRNSIIFKSRKFIAKAMAGRFNSDKMFLSFDLIISVSFSLWSSFLANFSEFVFLNYSLIKTIIPSNYKLRSNFYKNFSFYSRPRYKTFDVYTLNYRFEQRTKTRKHRAIETSVIKKIIEDLKLKTRRGSSFSELNKNNFKKDQRLPFFNTETFFFNSFKKKFKFSLFDHEFIDLFYTNYDNPYLNFFLPVKSFSFYRIFDNWLFPYQYTFPVGNYFFDYFIFDQNDLQTDFNIFDFYMQTHPIELEGYGYDEDNEEDEDVEGEDVYATNYISISRTEFEPNVPDGTTEDGSLGVGIQLDNDDDDFSNVEFPYQLDEEVEPEHVIIEGLDIIDPSYIPISSGPISFTFETNDIDESVLEEDEYLESNVEYSYIDIFDDDNSGTGAEDPSDFPNYFRTPPSSEDQIELQSSFFLNYFNEFQINPARTFPASTFLHYNRPKHKSQKSDSRLKEITDIVTPSLFESDKKVEKYKFFNFRKSLYYKRYRHFKFMGKGRSSNSKSFYSYSPFYNYFDINLQFFDISESKEDYADVEVYSEFEDQMYDYSFSDLNEFLDQENDDLDPDFFDFSSYTSVPFSRFFFGYAKSNFTPYVTSDFRYQTNFKPFGSFQNDFSQTSNSLTVTATNKTSAHHLSLKPSFFKIFTKLTFVSFYKFFRFSLLWFQYSYYFSKPEFQLNNVWADHYTSNAENYSSENFSKYFKFLKIWGLNIGKLSINNVRFDYFKNLYNPIYYSSNKSLFNEGLSNFFKYEPDSEYLNVEFFFESELYTRTLHNYKANSKTSLPVFFWNYDEYFLYTINSFDTHDFSEAFDFLDGNSLIWASRETINADSPDESIDLSPIYEELITKEANFYYSKFEIFVYALDEFLLLFVQFFVGFSNTFKSILINFSTSALIYWELKWLNLYLEYGYAVTVVRSFFSFSFFFFLSFYLFFTLPYLIFFFFPFFSYFSFFTIFSFSFFISIFCLAFISFKTFRFFYKSLTNDEFFAIVSISVIMWFQNVYFGYSANPYIMQNFFNLEDFENPGYTRTTSVNHFQQLSFKRPSNFHFEGLQNDDFNYMRSINQYSRLEQNIALYELNAPPYPVWEYFKRTGKIKNFPGAYENSFFLDYQKKFDFFDSESPHVRNSKKNYMYRLTTITDRGATNVKPLSSIYNVQDQTRDANATFNFRNIFEFIFDSIIFYPQKDNDYVYQPYRGVKRSFRMNRKLLQIHRSESIDNRPHYKMLKPKNFMIIDNNIRTFFFTRYFRRRPHTLQLYDNYMSKQTFIIYKNYRALIFKSLKREYYGAPYYDKNVKRYRMHNPYLKFFHTILNKPYTVDKFSTVRPFFPNYNAISPNKAHFLSEFNVYSPFTQFIHKNSNSYFFSFKNLNVVRPPHTEKFSFPQKYYPTAIDLKSPVPYWFENQKFTNSRSLIASDSSSSLVDNSMFSHSQQLQIALKNFQKRFSSDFYYYTLFRKGSNPFEQRTQFEVLKRFRFNTSKIAKVNQEYYPLFPAHYKFSSFNTGISQVPFMIFFNTYFFHTRLSYNLFTVLDGRLKNTHFTTYASRFLYNNVQNFRSKLNFDTFQYRYLESKDYRDKIDAYYSIYGQGFFPKFTFIKFRSLFLNSQSPSLRETYTDPLVGAYRFNKSFKIQKSSSKRTRSNFASALESFRLFQQNLYFNRQLTLQSFYPHSINQRQSLSFSNSQTNSNFSKQIRDIAIFRLSFIKFLENRKKFLYNYTNSNVLPIYSSSNYISSLIFCFTFNSAFSSKPNTNFTLNDLNYFSDFSVSSGTEKFVTEMSPFSKPRKVVLPHSDLFLINDRLDNFFSNAHLFAFTNRSFIHLQKQWVDHQLKGFNYTKRYNQLSQRSKKAILSKILYANLGYYFKNLELNDTKFFLNRFKKTDLFSDPYKMSEIETRFARHSDKIFKKYKRKIEYTPATENFTKVIPYFRLKKFTKIKALAAHQQLSSLHPYSFHEFNFSAVYDFYPDFYYSKYKTGQNITFNFKRNNVRFSPNVIRHRLARNLKRPSMLREPFFKGVRTIRGNFSTRQYLFLTKFVNVKF